MALVVAAAALRSRVRQPRVSRYSSSGGSAALAGFFRAGVAFFAVDLAAFLAGFFAAFLAGFLAVDLLGFFVVFLAGFLAPAPQLPLPAAKVR